MYTYSYMSIYPFIEIMWYEYLYENLYLGIFTLIRIGYIIDTKVYLHLYE